MKGFLIVVGLAMLGTGVYFAYQHEHGYPARRKRGRKGAGGCGCGGNGSGGGGAAGTTAGAGASEQGAGALPQGADMMMGGVGLPTGPGGAGGNFSQQLAVNAAVAGGASPASVPGAGATDELQPAGGLVAMNGGGGGGAVVAQSNSAAAASTFGSPQDWAGNTVPDVQANFVMANQMGSGGQYNGNAQGMVEHYNASREGTRVSPPITTVTIPGGSDFAQDMNWDRTETLVRY